eukprot:g12701.t1
MISIITGCICKDQYCRLHLFVDISSPEEPAKVGVAIADIATGLYAASAIQAALWERQRSEDRRGQYIDISLFDTQLAILANQASSFLVDGQVSPRLGTAHPSIVPYQAFPTRDGHIMIAVGNDAQYMRLCDAIEAPSWLRTDERFTTNHGRTVHRDILVPALKEVFKKETTSHWLDVLHRAKVPCGPINDLTQVFSERHVREKHLVREV